MNDMSEEDAFEAYEQRPLSQQAMGVSPYLSDLNPPQREAVETLDGPVLLLAGAGTGKTKALTTRLAHLIHTRRAWPSQILAVTFTNKAAREMKNRVGGLIGGAVEGMPWLGTFHSVCVKILRRHAELVELKSSFTILDTDDQIRLIKQIIDVEGIDPKRWPPRMFASMLDRWKNRAVSPGKVPPDECGFANGRGGELYRIYHERLRTLNAVDFGDLLLHVVTILQTHPDVLADYQQRFKYVLVDEYQDTNVAQYLLLRLLAAEHRNICCVGDDDQSIYGWRGAEVENILRFEKDFPDATVIRLERNYRSTPAILAAASGLIAENKSRLGKTLWTEEPDGDPVQIRGVWDADEEARQIGDDIEAAQAKGVKLSDMAVLVRASFQMRAFEERFIHLGLPYRVIGGPRFFEREEIRDAHAYLRLVKSQDDDLSFERICNKPRRGLGDKALQTLHLTARGQSISLMRAARLMLETDELRPQARKSLRGFVEAVDRWTLAAADIPHTELAEMILDESGYTEMWKNDKSPQAGSKLDNLKELVQAMGEFENLAGYLDHVSLVMELDQDSSGDRVSLMTLHAAKGLEFPLVFLPGWEEGIFPSQRSVDEKGQEGLEEERRLAYVGLTRAMESARIFFAANRQVYGRWQNAIPSRFIDELPKQHIDIVSEPGLYGAPASNMPGLSRFDATRVEEDTYYDNPGWRRARAAKARKSAPPPLLEGKAELMTTSAPDASAYAVGERIFHQKFGYGRISAIEGNKLAVDFEKAGAKRVLESFVEKT
ncbi:MAG: UvrD-helicase domain-containing protein [Pseudomonadota bacterium]